VAVVGTHLDNEFWAEVFAHLDKVVPERAR